MICVLVPWDKVKEKKSEILEKKKSGNPAHKLGVYETNFKSSCPKCKMTFQPSHHREEASLLYILKISVTVLAQRSRRVLGIPELFNITVNDSDAKKTARYSRGSL